MLLNASEECDDWASCVCVDECSCEQCVKDAALKLRAQQLQMGAGGMGSSVRRRWGRNPPTVADARSTD